MSSRGHLLVVMSLRSTSFNLQKRVHNIPRIEVVNDLIVGISVYREPVVISKIQRP